MTVRVAWDAETPAEIRAALAPILDRLLPFVPGWVHELRVGYDNANTDAIAYNRTRPEYRWARIMVCGGWLSETEPERAGIILHELLHIAVEPLASVGEQYVAVLAKDAPALESIATEQLRRAEEGAICDLSVIVMTAMAMESSAAAGIQVSPLIVDS